MGLHVSSQIGPVRKPLPAVGTGIRFLPRVRPHVTLQQPRPGESLSAHNTLVGRGVGENVHGEGGSADIGLIANMAWSGSLSVELIVRLLVPGQVGVGGKKLATFQTLILSLVCML